MADVDDWAAKAEEDWSVATGLKRRRVPVLDTVCFHCQQCMEKYLKGFLVLHHVTPPKIHDLVELVHHCAAIDPGLDSLAEMVRPLNAYAVKARYPGAACTRAEATDAVTRTRAVRGRLREALGL